MENINIEQFLTNVDETKLDEVIEKARQKKKRSLDRRVVELEDWQKKASARIKILINDNKELGNNVTDLKKKLKEVEIDTKSVTDTLIIHGTERRMLENHIHSLVFHELGKNTLRNDLFHGLLTRNCKAHLSKSLAVASFNWINVNDLNTAKTLANRYLNKTTIHMLMRKKADEIFKKFDKINKSKKKVLTEKQIAQYHKLELLIEECGGNIYEI